MAALFVESGSWTDISSVIGAVNTDTLVVQNLGSRNIFTSESVGDPGPISDLSNLRKINPGDYLQSSNRPAGAALWGIVEGDELKVRYSVEINNA